ncbi:hypothetical protein C8Q70DRAFT_478794 [Cubamyces menziesii]|nr:hypothetical protein C8Q70DRAFT_478794 [Cubamyces menziesii]
MPRRGSLQARLTGVCILSKLLVSTIPRTAALDVPPSESCSDSSYSWMYNSQGLSPCQVAMEVLLVQSYGTGESVNQYACNAVMYSLWAACLLCNGQSPDNFSAYSDSWGCAGQFSTPSSSRVDIPGWANLPLIDDNTFNEQAAKQETRPRHPRLRLKVTIRHTAALQT